MATEKNILGRIVHKHDIEANWDKAVNFVPKQGEIIIYDIDNNYSYERFKVGDGITTAIELPFYLEHELNDAINNINENARKINYLADNTLTANWENGTLILDKGIEFPEIF